MIRFAASLLAMTLLFASCDLLGGYPGPGGGLALEVNEQGHLTTTATYDSGYFVETYNPDGTFERGWYSSAGAGVKNAQTDGDRGTYTYVPSTMKLTLVLTQYYNSSTSAWVEYAKTVDYQYTSTKLLMEHSACNVFLQSGSAWSLDQTYAYSDTANPTSGSVTTYTRTLGLAAGTGGRTYTYVGTVVPKDQGAYVSYRIDTVGDAKVLGATKILTPGATVTFESSTTSYTTRTWNYQTGVLDPAVEGTLGYQVDTVYSVDGKSLIYFASNAQRSVLPQQASTGPGTSSPPPVPPTAR